MECEKCGYTPNGVASSCPRCGAPLGVAQPSPVAGYDGGWLTAGDGPGPAADRTVVRPSIRNDRPVVAERASDPYPEDQNLSHYASAPAGEWPASAPVQTPLPTAGPPTLSPATASAAGPWLDQAGGDPRYLPTATLGVRFAAQLLDSLVMSAVALAAGLVGGVLVAGMMSNSSTAGLQVVLLLAQLAVTVVIVGYFVRGWGRGQTIGKRAMRIAVTDVSTGGPIGYGRAFGRYLMMMVMALPLYLGFLSLLSEDRRGWHDKAANSRVVKLPDAYR